MNGHPAPAQYQPEQVTFLYADAHIHRDARRACHSPAQMSWRLRMTGSRNSEKPQWQWHSSRVGISRPHRIRRLRVHSSMRIRIHYQPSSASHSHLLSWSPPHAPILRNEKLPQQRNHHSEWGET